MASIKDKLTKYYDELKVLFDEVEWYASPNQLDTIDEGIAILNYTTANHNADAQPYYSQVTLSVYLANNDDHTEDLRELGYDVTTETNIDDKLNTDQILSKTVLIL